jgi:RNA polymerase sigma-70 factor (ECF subfamily)
MNAAAPAMLDCRAHEDPRAADLMQVLEEQRSSLLAFLHKRLGNEEDVHDALQETSLRLFNFQAHATAESPAALIYSVADRVAVDFVRRRASRRASAHCALEDVELLSPEPSPDQVASAGQDLDQLIEALERLTPKCQDVFLLSRMEGLSYPQIAARCGISVKMVEKYMSRALAELRKQVGDAAGAAT